jgi:hypothetical protein
MQTPTRSRRLWLALSLALALALPLTVWLTAGRPSHADELTTAASAKLVAPLVDEQTIVVVRLRPHQLDIGGLQQSLGRMLPEVIQRELSQPLDMLKRIRQDFTQAGVSDVYILVNIDDLNDGRPPALAVTLAGKSQPEVITKFLQDEFGLAYQTKRVGDVLLLGDAMQLRRLTAARPAHPQFAAALAATEADATAQVVWWLNPDQRRVIAEMMPELPPDLGGRSTKALTDGMNWLSLGVGSKGGVSLRLEMECKDGPAAAELAKLWGSLLDALGRQPAGWPFVMREFAGQAKTDKTYRDLDPAGFDRMRKQLGGQVAGARLSVAMLQTPDYFDALTKLLTEQAREAAQAAQDFNNLKQIGLAMHNHHDAYGRLPQNITDQNGRLLLSWRVAILPFLEQEALYKQFRLNEPWDSEHNKKLIAQMPKVYRSPASQAPAGKTRYLGPVTNNSMFPPKLPKSGLTLTDVTDGTSNTLWVIEVNDDFAVEWTRPSDWVLDQEPLKALQNVSPLGVPALFVDGSVRRLQPTITEKVLRAMISRNGGEVIPND